MVETFFLSFFLFFKLLAISTQKKARVISLRKQSLFERSGSDIVAVVHAVTAMMGNAHVMNRQAHKASAATNYSIQISCSITLLVTAQPAWSSPIILFYQLYPITHQSHGANQNTWLFFFFFLTLTLTLCLQVIADPLPTLVLSLSVIVIESAVCPPPSVTRDELTKTRQRQSFGKILNLQGNWVKRQN